MDFCPGVLRRGIFCGETMKKRQHAAALLGTLVCLVLALVLYHSLAGGTLMQAGPYNSYALQAENWLAGRNYIANGEDYPWLELAIYSGRYYQSFPPVPAVLMLPFVAAFGSWQALPGGLIMLELALLCAAGVYLCCMRSGMSADVCAYFAVFVSMGSNLFWMSTSDGVWFMAQLCGLLFAVWGLYWAQGRGAVQAALASLCMALAVGCRPFYALLLACWMAWRAYKTRSVRALLPALLPAVAAAVCMMVYNWVRFGSVVEFGHNYLPEFTRAEHGQFSLHYLLPNLRQLLRPVTLDAQGQLHFEQFNGFLFFAANPLCLLAMSRGVAVSLSGHAEPRRENLPLPAAGWCIAAACALLTALTCMHRTLGGWQFGARYMVDLFPWLLIWFMARPAWRPGAGAKTLCGMAVLFNLYGAVFMLGA